MKRKFKLLTSVASLCLAVSLLAFGVYSATQPKVTISGTVSFNAENVFATVRVYKYVGATALAIDGTGWVQVETDLSFTNTEATDKTASIGDLALNDTNLVAQYKIVVQNDFADKATDKVYVKVAPSNAEQAGMPTGVTVEKTTETGEATATDFSFMVTYTVNPVAAGTTFTPIDFGGTTVTISRAAIA